MKLFLTLNFAHLDRCTLGECGTEKVRFVWGLLVASLGLLRVLYQLPTIILVFLSANNGLIRPHHRRRILLSQVMHLLGLLPEVLHHASCAHGRQVVRIWRQNRSFGCLDITGRKNLLLRLLRDLLMDLLSVCSQSLVEVDRILVLAVRAYRPIVVTGVSLVLVVGLVHRLVEWGHVAALFVGYALWVSQPLRIKGLLVPLRPEL